MFRSLAPGFLLATPTLQDPSFLHTVVLLVRHTPQGAMGMIVNRPGPRRLGELLQSAGIDVGGHALDRLPVCDGGPVSCESGWVVFEGSDPRGESFDTLGDVRVTGSIEVFRDLMTRDCADRVLFLLGYAGWAAGQLEDEVAAGAWVPIPMSPKILFETPFEQRWRDAFLSVGIDPGLWSFQTGEG